MVRVCYIISSYNVCPCLLSNFFTHYSVSNVQRNLDHIVTRDDLTSAVSLRCPREHRRNRCSQCLDTYRT